MDWLKPFLTDHAITCGVNGLTSFICLWCNTTVVTIGRVRVQHTLPFMTKQRGAIRLRLPPDGTRSYGIIETQQPFCHFGLFEARCWNSGFSTKSKKLDKVWLYSVGKAWLWQNILSCIFITNHLNCRKSTTMQGPKNIAKILLLLWQFSMYFMKHKCATV